MKYLQRAVDLADARGYFRYPEVLVLHGRVPAWFHAFASDGGVAEFEARRGFRVPAAMRELYAFPPLACFLEATLEGEVFLNELASLIESEVPPIVTWSARPHLVYSFQSHTGMAFAAALGSDDPLAYCGYFNVEDPIRDASRPPTVFSAWVFDAVDGHETRLDYWQGIYEKAQHDPAESSCYAWIRNMPGMAPRLK